MSDEVHETAIDAEATKRLADQGLRFELLKTTDKTFSPWFQAMERGFLNVGADDETIEARVDALAHRRLSGLWDDAAADAATPIATASSWMTDLTIPGGRSIPSWAISTITVAPTHRRRGIARNLMEAELRTAATLKIPVAILTASEATIYERFGFAPVAMRSDWTINTKRTSFIGPTPDGKVQFVTREQARDEGGHDILERARLLAPAQIFFNDHLWRRIFGMPGRAEPKSIRVVRYDDADDVPQGLAVYKVEEHHDRDATLHLEYLTTATDDAYAALWRYLLEHDLVGEIKAPLRSVNEPIRWQLSNPRAATEDIGDHLWLRVLDVKTTLEARHYNAPGTFVLELDDPMGFADGCYLLNIDNSGMAVVTRLDDRDGFEDNHHLAMSAAMLAAIYLGGTSVSTLVRAGRITQKTPGAAAAADAAFRSTTAPWSSIWF